MNFILALRLLLLLHSLRRFMLFCVCLLLKPFFVGERVHLRLGACFTAKVYRISLIMNGVFGVLHTNTYTLTHSHMHARTDEFTVFAFAFAALPSSTTRLWKNHNFYQFTHETHTKNVFFVRCHTKIESTEETRYFFFGMHTHVQFVFVKCVTFRQPPTTCVRQPSRCVFVSCTVKPHRVDQSNRFRYGAFGLCLWGVEHCMRLWCECRQFILMFHVSCCICQSDHLKYSAVGFLLYYYPVFSPHYFPFHS